MITENLAQKINYQINREIYSGYLYLGMASYADSLGLKGFSNWFKHQFKEEMEHADKMCDYLNEKGVRVIMEAIEKPPQDFNSAKELFEKTYNHEKNVTKLIHDLSDIAKNENDKESEEFLAWFIKEQVEEEGESEGEEGLGEEKAGEKDEEWIDGDNRRGEEARAGIKEHSAHGEDKDAEDGAEEGLDDPRNRVVAFAHEAVAGAQIQGIEGHAGDSGRSALHEIARVEEIAGDHIITDSVGVVEFRRLLECPADTQDGGEDHNHPKPVRSAHGHL